ncbi:AAA family ATPase [Acidipila sp. EB88]|uniref:AAA family ATPase n=1 Tax=Acidipila sp. EB88 TaxID=2305226 RepID=UPI000F5E0937|nr:AAA family ATPase [Acidipila sp. EB88]RRA47287.1 chromosome segregation protein SMC [Acidipila sp. EB88]
MLKLKKIQILGFKSFCDKTEVQLPGNGIAVVVGPNGCGKSNILDGVTWVLGEQSAKSLRGGKMEDVIFAGTRDRRSVGMAEVSITLIDPDAYGSGPLSDEPEILVDSSDASLDDDWDEAKLRAAKADEVEQLIAEAQPGQVLDVPEGSNGPEASASQPGQSGPDSAATAAGQPTEAEHAPGSNDVVLKIRRRKFQKTPRHGEIVITRRLFRTGDSEYLLNGKLCRLSDIRDIFMGTGLGPESYAIIGQERIGQLLSSKPHDRRAIIEEAAGITRFKTRKRLAELRLEQARQNLARIDDIFDEVTKQMVSLRRQAAKAERYGVLRDELRGRLRIVLATRLVRMDATLQTLEQEIATLSTGIDTQSHEVEQLQSEVSAGQERGYAVDASAKEQGRLASESAVELERARSRQHSNAERLAELEHRIDSNTAELAQAHEQRAGLESEKDQQQQFLATAAAEAESFRAEAAGRQHAAREAASAVAQAEARVEAARREANQLLQQVANVRREQAQAEEALLSVDRDASRLAGELEAARRDLEALGVERGQVSLRFESASETLKRLESELAALRAEVSAKRAEEQENRRRGDTLRSERATLAGRAKSLESLLREHSYSTDTVKKLLRADALSGDAKPLGTLADLLEVGEQYEAVVDDFLRDELNYVVVRNWTAATHGLQLLRRNTNEGGIEGRATFLVHPENSDHSGQSPTGAQQVGAALPDAVPPAIEAAGVVSLRACIGIAGESAGSNGASESTGQKPGREPDAAGQLLTALAAAIPRLGNGYVCESADLARTLALAHPEAFFLAPDGECFHSLTASGGKTRSGGPLALKRELRDVQTKLSSVETSLAQSEMQTAALGHTLAELARRIDSQTEERRHAERESAHESAALRQMEGERQRLERRLQEYTLQGERARSQRDEKTALIARKAEDAERLEQSQQAVEARQEELLAEVAQARAARDTAQSEAASVAAELAGLEERRRGAEAGFARTERLCAEATRRIDQLEQQIESAHREQAQRSDENDALAAREHELHHTRQEAEAQVRTLAEEASALRARLAEAETQLKQLRAATEAAREQRAGRTASSARLTAELAHLAEACVQDLGVEADQLRAATAASEIEPLAAESLAAEEEACREMKRRLEAMGPVNMMALEEFKETETRHQFLETQRKDLLDSIENTRSTIRELDGISRTKFDDAFERINQNFSEVFARLFGGGVASMRLTDEENSGDSGIDIVAQPPGKKLQNVFLLSGGEKALTALSLLMGIFMFQPAPFCVLDEVDAPLDETNVGRLADLLRSMSIDTQFVMVTHSKRMMTAADMIYGVTMQEPGVSKVVSVRMGGKDATQPRSRERRELATV